MPNKTSTTLLKHLGDGIFSLTLNRPDQRNALSAALMESMHQQLTEVRKNRDCRVLILTGAGHSFCAGADLKDTNGGAPGTEGMSELGLVYKTQEYLAELVCSLRELPQPVISAVNGFAVGGGLALVLASDICIAQQDASFGAVFIKAGLSSCDVGTSYMLPRMIGPQRAAELMLTGRIIDSAEAQDLGLVCQCVPTGTVLDVALEKARMIAQNNEYGVWMTKKGLWANLDAPSLRHAIEMENRTQVLGYFTGNMKEAMQAFMEKRAPKWKRL